MGEKAVKSGCGGCGGCLVSVIGIVWIMALIESHEARVGAIVFIVAIVLVAFIAAISSKDDKNKQSQVSSPIVQDQPSHKQNIPKVSESVHDNNVTNTQPIIKQQARNILTEKQRSSVNDSSVMGNICESPIEKQFWEAAHDKITGLTPQYPISSYRVDFAVPERRIVIELDGHEHHKTKEQRTADAKRERDLQILGWAVIRFTGTEIYHNPDKCAIEAKQLCDRHAQQYITCPSCRELLKIPSDNGKYTCHNCNKPFSYVDRVAYVFDERLHNITCPCCDKILECPSENGRYSCPYCEKFFVYTHGVIEREEGDKENIRVSFACPFCKKLVAISREGKHICGFCKSKFSYVNGRIIV